MTQQPIRILIVDDSAMVRNVLSQLLASEPDMVVVGTSATGHDAVSCAGELQPDIVLMDIHMPDLDGIQAAWLVSSKVPLGGVIMVTSEARAEYLQRAMIAGAQGYVLKPFGDGAYLLRTIRETHKRVRARQLQTNVPSAEQPAEQPVKPAASFLPGKRVAVFGAKGGLGRTLVAVSLALALRQSKGESVVLVDADFRFGDADMHLNLTTERNILDLLPHIEVIDSQLVQQVVGKHSSGVHLLARPPRAEEADAIKEIHIRMLVSSLGALYDWVILDTPPSYDDRMLAVLDLVDVYVVVLAPSLGALRNTRHFLDVARKLGYSEDRMCFVLNHANNSSSLSIDAVAKVVGTRRIFQLPSGGPQPTQAFNGGLTFMEAHATSPLARALQDVAKHVRLMATDAAALRA